jgi:poly(3-hydroxybutyrate) depolymerase
MLYRFYELQRQLLGHAADLAGYLRTTDRAAMDTLDPLHVLRASWALTERLGKRYPRQPFGITETARDGQRVAIVEEVVVEGPFCRLVRFRRETGDAATGARLAGDPRVLLCAPLSGHHPTLLRDTITTLAAEHDVYVTDWRDARDVPVHEGELSLADYVELLVSYITRLGAEDLHVVAVCQPTVPALAATALLATRGEATPRTLTLLGGPIDARRSPTAVTELARRHPLAWFERTLIHRVPDGYAGAGRRVYPGFLQLTAFVSMNPARHFEAYHDYWLAHLRGADGAGTIAQHERFYDEYNAVLDMDARYYLDTVRDVFQDFALARGIWRVHGELVEPHAITHTALLTIEGAADDISGLGQTAAAHELCTGIAEASHRAYVADGVGHYGLFSGSRWREAVSPQIHGFIREHARSQEHPA